MGKSTDAILAKCATCSKEELVEVAAHVCDEIEEESAVGNVASAALYRDLSRVIDGMGELRFSRWWPAHSPARRRDPRSALELPSNARLILH